MAPHNPFSDIEQKLNTAAACSLRVFGVRRCGNHGIINWLIRNSGQETYVFLNSCTNSRSSVQTCGASEISGLKYGNKQRLANAIGTEILETEQKPFVIISYEAGLQKNHYETGEQTPEFANSDFDREILITRSFANWLAGFAVLVGRMFKARPELSIENTAVIINDIAVYKAHLAAVEARLSADNFMHICYDNWYENPDYRSKILSELGLPEVNNSLGQVQRYGGGSSFSDQIDAAGMDVTARWKNIQSAQLLNIIKLVLLDDELLRLIGHFYPNDIEILRSLAG